MVNRPAVFVISRQSQESQKEMKVMLDVYKAASKDSRERLEVFMVHVWFMYWCGMCDGMMCMVMECAW